MSNRITFGLAVCLAAAALPRPAGAQCDAPSLLIILDKSSSMVTGSVPSGITKWEAARRAVGNITTRFDETIDFGLLVFPDPNQCNVSAVAVDIGAGTADAIAGYLATPPPTGGNWTPMSRALDVAAAYAPLSDESRRRVAVLVTDGWQWCDPYDPATRFDPVEHAAAVRATGTTLYVVGFGDGVDALTLNRIAYQSGTYVPGCDPTGDTPTTPDPCYLKAEDTSSLEAALDAIARHATEEVCDDIDNDCDDSTDESLSRACSTICGGGTETCAAGVWRDCSAPAPAPSEICDGTVDDDCDGLTDEGCACVNGDIRECGTDAGDCEAGLQECVDGAWDECLGEVGPTTEACDGADNDCDGTTDEGCDCVAGDSRACGSDTGACVPGTQACSGGSWGPCGGGVDPVDETCDGTDDDCDGDTDEGCLCVDGTTRSCGVDAGTCVSGTQTCGDGAWGDCDGFVGPEPETCDGLDNDCNGTADEGCLCAEGDTRSCGVDVGACSGGTQTCRGGAWGGCDGAVEPATETCNDVDDDCDTMTDEGCICAEGETRPCGTDTGACTAGTQTCSAGRWSECDGAVWPDPEECNGEDDDCNGTADDGAVCPPGLACRAGVCTEGSPDPEPPPPDGGTPPGDSAGAGCGCAVPGAPGLAGAILLGVAVCLAAARRRRR
jgi:MYXO-CTERM domain-containing protein